MNEWMNEWIGRKGRKEEKERRAIMGPHIIYLSSKGPTSINEWLWRLTTYNVWRTTSHDSTPSSIVPPKCLNIGIFPLLLSTLFLRQGFSLNLKFIHLSRMANQWAPVVLSFPSTRIQTHISMPGLHGCWESERSSSFLHGTPLLVMLICQLD